MLPFFLTIAKENTDLFAFSKTMYHIICMLVKSASTGIRMPDLKFHVLESVVALNTLKNCLIYVPLRRKVYVPIPVNLYCLQ